MYVPYMTSDISSRFLWFSSQLLYFFFSSKNDFSLDVRNVAVLGIWRSKKELVVINIAVGSSKVIIPNVRFLVVISNIFKKIATMIWIKKWQFCRKWRYVEVNKPHLNLPIVPIESARVTVQIVDSGASWPFSSVSTSEFCAVIVFLVYLRALDSLLPRDHWYQVLHNAFCVISPYAYDNEKRISVSPLIDFILDLSKKFYFVSNEKRIQFLLKHIQ